MTFAKKPCPYAFFFDLISVLVKEYRKKQQVPLKDPLDQRLSVNLRRYRLDLAEE